MNSPVETGSPLQRTGLNQPSFFGRAIHHPGSWLFLFALTTRLLVIALARFDGLYGQDAYAYYDYARQLITTSFGTSLPGPVYWPLGYPALAGLFLRLTGLAPLGAQLASVISGAATAPVVYLITLELSPAPPRPGSPTPSPALAAGLLTALSGQLLQSSISIMADAPALFWAVFCTYALLCYDRTRRGIWLPLAATTLALAIVTRWIFAGLVLPFGLFAFSAIRRHLTLSPRHLVTHSISLIFFALILFPQLLFSQTSAAPVLQHSWLVNWNPFNAFRTSFDNSDGHFDYRLPPVLFYAEPLFHPFYLFPLLTPFIFVGAWGLRRSRKLILLGGWVLVLYLYLMGIPYENFRFGLAYFPPIAILAALGLYSLPLHALSRLSHPRLSLVILHLIFAISLLAALPLTYRGLSAFLSIKSRELAALHYLQSRIPPDATVLTFGLTLSLDHYTNLHAVELFSQSPGTLPSAICSAAPVYLFVETDNIEAQWLGKTPDVNFRWLRDQAGLNGLGRFDTWTLYAIQKKSCPAARARFATLKGRAIRRSRFFIS